MLAEPHVLRPIGAQHHHLDAVESIGQVGEDVGRSHVRPMQVLDEQDQRPFPRQVLQEERDLPLQPLLRDHHLRPASVDRFRLWDDLRPPGRRDLPQEVTDLFGRALASKQGLERFDQRQVRFGTRQPLRATAPGDRDLVGRHLREEALGHGRLAHARLARNANDPTLSFPGQSRKLRAEGVQDRLSPDDVGRPYEGVGRRSRGSKASRATPPPVAPVHDRVASPTRPRPRGGPRWPRPRRSRARSQGPRTTRRRRGREGPGSRCAGGT